MDDRIRIPLDAGKLKTALAKGRKAIKPLQDQFSKAADFKADSIKIKKPRATVQAKCAHGLAFELADHVLHHLEDGIEIDQREIRNLYARIGNEYRRILASSGSVKTAEENAALLDRWESREFRTQEAMADKIDMPIRTLKYQLKRAREACANETFYFVHRLAKNCIGMILDMQS